MQIELLKRVMPTLAESLGQMYIDRILTMMQETEVTFDQVTPSISIILDDHMKDGVPFRITLMAGYLEERKDEKTLCAQS